MFSTVLVTGLKTVGKAALKGAIEGAACGVVMGTGALIVKGAKSTFSKIKAKKAIDTVDIQADTMETTSHEVVDQAEYDNATSEPAI